MRLLLTASALLTLPLAGVQAATIVEWNEDNVVRGPVDQDATDDVGGASVVYDRDVTGGGGIGEAITYGKVTYIAPESNTPGIKIDNDDYTGAKKQEFDGCIMTSSEANCDSEFQSGKRIKQQVTGVGPIDLVFDIASVDGETTNLYQVFHRLINVTGEMLTGFTVELGTGIGSGIGSGFVRSSKDDGLGFADIFSFGPGDLAAFSQYPFGLFGGEPLNPNPLKLPGFFDTVERAGFNVVLDEDKMTSTGYYGSYDNLFGNWLSQEDVPLGLFYDYLTGADPLLMAWDNGEGWEFLRGFVDQSLNTYGVNPIASQFFAYDFGYDPINGISAVMEAYLAANFGAKGIDLLMGAIEDLANLNLTFALAIDDSFAKRYGSFTMRVTPIAPIPLPAGAPLLIGALGALALLRRRARLAA
jgi:hypothetical protein